MALSFDEIDERLPTHIPLNTDFEEAILWAQTPLITVMETLKVLGMAGEKVDNALVNIGHTIGLYLEQMDYILKHAFVGENSIFDATIKHPFEIIPHVKKVS